jgi:hypothetical protein
MSTGGVAKRIIRFSIATVGHFRGGLAMAGVLACMMFAALSGSSPATVVAIGTIAIAGMRQVGYSKEFAAGVIANAGTLGILIPPSIVMVVYAAATNVSVGRMFLAGVIPGILAGLMLMIAIYVIARRRTCPEEWKGFGELMNGGKEAGWGLFLIVIIIGGIYGGVFTPTEAAAVAAVYAFFIATFVYRDMGPMAGRRWLRKDEMRAARRRISASPRRSMRSPSSSSGWCCPSSSPPTGRTSPAPAAPGSALRLSLAVLVAYAVWRDPASNPLNIPRFIAAGLPVWGRNLALMGRHFPGAFFHADTRKVMIDSSKDHHHADVHHRERAAVRPCLTAERIPAGDHRLMVDAGFTWFTFLIAVNLAAVARRPVHGTVRPAPDRRPGRFPDRHGTRRRSDPSRHHHGGQYGDRHDYPADRAEPVRHLRHHRNEPDPGRARRGALRRRPARLPGAGDLHPGPVDGAALCADGTGNRHPLRTQGRAFRKGGPSFSEEIPNTSVKVGEYLLVNSDKASSRGRNSRGHSAAVAKRAQQWQIYGKIVIGELYVFAVLFTVE